MCSRVWVSNVYAVVFTKGLCPVWACVTVSFDGRVCGMRVIQPVRVEDCLLWRIVPSSHWFLRPCILQVFVYLPIMACECGGLYCSQKKNLVTKLSKAKMIG